MLTLLAILFWLAVCVGALALLGFYTGRLFRVLPEPHALVFVTTADGWRLSLSHYRPSQRDIHAPPVLLCAGPGLNSTIFDLSPDSSLARYLARLGYDVWLLDLRGTGSAYGPSLWDRRRGNWSFDDYVEFDIPAALATIGELTGQPQAQCIGFGTGGLALLGVLCGPDGGRVRSLVAIGTSAVFQRQRTASRARWLRWVRWARPELIVRLVAPLLGRWYPPPLGALQNRDNIDPQLYRRALVNAANGCSPTELLQYAEWLEHDTFTAVVQRRDYRALMTSIKVPTLFVAGQRDELAPTEMVEATYNLLEGAEEKALLVAGRSQGMSTNYGHLDLLIGRGVQRDVFSHLVRWLDRHAGVPLPAERPAPPEPTRGWSEDSDRLRLQRASQFQDPPAFASGLVPAAALAFDEEPEDDEEPGDNEEPEDDEGPEDNEELEDDEEPGDDEELEDDEEPGDDEELEDDEEPEDDEDDPADAVISGDVPRVPAQD